MRQAGIGLAFAGVLAGPLSGCAEDPFSFDAPRSCEAGDQNAWVSGVMDEVYLFAEHLPEVDPLDYAGPAQMMRDLRVDPDRWSRVSDKATTDALFVEGAYIGFGHSTRRSFTDEVVVVSVAPDSPAAAAGLQRGDKIAAIGGLRIAQIDNQDRWSEIYGENEPGVSVEFSVDDGSDERNVTLTKDWIAIDTVPFDSVLEVDGRPVGYLMFASFLEPAHDELDAAFERLATAGVREVVVDVRYNGGGLLTVAQHLVGLLVGDIAAGKTAYRIRYNDRYGDQNTDREMSDYAGSLPGVEHVVFITTGSTLSASELVINAVRPYVDVSIVGDTTGGKPVGSRHFDFCDKVLAPITFELVNAEDEGDYFDGIAADCPAVDDFAHDLGDPQEASLAAAIALLRGEACPQPPVRQAEQASAGWRVPLAAPDAASTPPPPQRAAGPLWPGRPEELRGVW